MNKILDKVEESFVLKFNQEANVKKQKGEKVYNLTIGQLNFLPPEEIREKIRNLTEDLKSYQYTSSQGILPLRESVLRFYKEERKVDLEGFDVLVSNGVKQALYTALKAFLNPKDKVGLLVPYWLSYPPLVYLNHGDCIFIKEKNYLPDLKDLEKKLKKIKILLINNPNNPSGKIYPESFLKELNSLLKKYPDVYLFSDEIYADLCFNPFKNFYDLDPELLKRTLIFYGPSKSFAVAGLRLGFCLAPKNILPKLNLLQSHISSNTCHLLQLAFQDYKLPEKYIQDLRFFIKNQSVLVQKVLKKFKLSKLYYESEGAFYFLLNLKKMKITEDPVDLMKRLSLKNIYFIPGNLFGLNHCLRISLSVSPEELEEGLEKLLKELI